MKGFDVIWILMVIAVIAGTVTPIQSGINATLAKHLSQPFHAGLISFTGGFVLMLAASFITAGHLPRFAEVLKVPPVYLIGGVFGAIFVTTAIFLAPRLGATVFLSCVIAGQLLASVVIDHYGWIGFEQHSVTWPRIIGVALLFVGALLVRIF